jgi:magnesium transporter
MEVVMIRTLLFTFDGNLISTTDPDPAELAAQLAQSDSLLWMDFEHTSPEKDALIMDNVFMFHPLAIEDALQQTNVPKIDDWETYIYIVLETISFEINRNDPIEVHELDVFLGKNYLVTHHDDPISAIERTREICQRDERIMRKGSDHLLYKLCDEVFSGFLPIVEDLDDEIDRTEDEVFDRATPETLARIFRLKRSVLILRRVLGLQREVLNRLARDEYAVIDRKVRIYFRDIYDQLVRMHEIVEGMRDLAGGTLDTYLSVINNRMNDIMKTLTLITTLFMPISFLVGFFGMNFLARPIHSVAGLDLKHLS